MNASASSIGISVASDSFQAGVVLYDGEHALHFGDGLHAVPLHRLSQGLSARPQ